VATTTKPLLSLTVGELMSADLLLIPQEMSLQMAARLLSRHQVSGAPVVDSQGHCVGVLSSIDFMHWVEKEKAQTGDKENTDFHSSWQMESGELLPADTIVHNMTADPVIASRDQPIRELARRMLDAHVHRVIVVDEQNFPLGVVTATDLLAAIAYAETE
jgi:predicted transcriptional regulator